MENELWDIFLMFPDGDSCCRNHSKLCLSNRLLARAVDYRLSRHDGFAYLADPVVETIFSDGMQLAVYSGTLVKTKIDKFLNVSGSRHCSIEQQCREVALCWRDVPDG